MSGEATVWIIPLIDGLESEVRRVRFLENLNFPRPQVLRDDERYNASILVMFEDLLWRNRNHSTDNSLRGDCLPLRE
jgi:hypothetical protein